MPRMWFGDENFTREKVFKALKAEFERRQEKNAQYSLRAFARDLDVDHSMLAKVLRGERPVSWDIAVKCKTFIGVK